MRQNGRLSRSESGKSVPITLRQLQLPVRVGRITRDTHTPTSYLVAVTRSLWSRALALFVGLWFVAVSAGPELAHACPTHGNHAMATALGDMPGGHGGTATAGAHHRAPNTESHQQHGSQCTCLGHCCSAPPVALVATTIALADVVTAAANDAGLPDYAYVPVAAQHVLPLANGPPLAA